MISKLIPVELREVWKKEAKDFTTWLGNNLDCLKDQLGIDLIMKMLFCKAAWMKQYRGKKGDA